MPESNFSQTNDHATLRQLVRDAESQIENMTTALETLRATVRRLAAQVEMGEGAAPSIGSGHGFGRAPQPDAAPPTDEKPFDFSAAAAALSQEIETASHAEVPAVEAPEAPSSHQKAVANPAPAPSKAEPEWYGVSDGGSWPVGPKSTQHPEKDEWAIKAPASPVGAWPDAGATEDEFEPVAIIEDTTADVAEAVAAQEEPVAAAMDPAFDFEARMEPDTPVSQEAADAAADAAEEEAKEEQKRLSLSSGWPDEGIWSQSFDWPAMRSGTAGTPANESPVPEPKDEFRSMVDQVRAEIEAARANGEPIELDDTLEIAEDDDEDARRAEVQRMVEEMRNASMEAIDGEGGDGAFEPTATVDMPMSEEEETKREEARLAVEQMRSEMAGDNPRVSFDPPPAPAPSPSIDWSHMQADISGPPVIVVKDTEGRVELANVYDLLNRLDCGESAALLNYTPHSVTVGLPIRAAMPSPEAVKSAVGAVFGRMGVVDTDGVRITVQMGTEGKKKRSEDAA